MRKLSSLSRRARLGSAAGKGEFFLVLGSALIRSIQRISADLNQDRPNFYTQHKKCPGENQVAFFPNLGEYEGGKIMGKCTFRSTRVVPVATP